MPVTASCVCTNTFSLKDEYAGRMVQCPACGSGVRAGEKAFTAEPTADPIFGRDVYLMRQQAFKVNERYDVSDESGKPVLFIERPAHLLRNLGALLAAIAAAFVWFWLAIAATDAVGLGQLANIISMIGLIGAIVIAVVVGRLLSRKRHVSFYTSQDKAVRVLEVLQDHKMTFVTATYTVRDAEGTEIARLRKNYLYNFFRRKWEVLRTDGTVAWVAREDSIILSLVRRFVPFMGLLRTNFIFQPAGSERVIGEFRRKLTILDRYVLDLGADPARAFDRRVAVALGVMLDTGERR